MAEENTQQNPFGGLFGFPFFSGPPQTAHVEVYETESELVVEANLPYYKREDVGVELVTNGLLITAEATAPTDDSTEEDNQPSSQTLPPRFERFIPVGFPFTAEDVTAEFTDKNHLTVRVGKNDKNRTFIPVQEAKKEEAEKEESKKEETEKKSSDK
ncbi:Hsp20/alpha crystallin family protein [Texcoconibacillus texcoconensis]|uniref:HSP20 family protein n=1 Tax=Texcoconibacillus texcoconensis TaxID=1095777 RepID=A0A840QS19_9BACI|nr:Hsp20/alpha crystallin family protein [Texcoconibacillus texcoconensis]MBB5174292.1 HSP20 family protein [Texcoconibacillus texcoconensis]